MTHSPELDLLRWLARRTFAAAGTIGAAYVVTLGEVRACLRAGEA